MKFFRNDLSAILCALIVPLFLMPETATTHAGTWDDVQTEAWDSLRDISTKGYAEQKQFEKKIGRRRSEILQGFEFHKDAAKGAINKCDRAYYEAVESAAFKFRDQKKGGIRKELQLSAREISSKKRQAAELEKKYDAYFKQLDELALYERITTRRHKELLRLTAAALIESARANERLEFAKFKNKQLDNLSRFLSVHRWVFPNYPTPCLVETEGKAVAQPGSPVDLKERLKDQAANHRDSETKDTRHYLVDDALNYTKIEREADKTRVKPDGSAHTLVDYCNIVADPKFQNVCYGLWSRACDNIANQEDKDRCKGALQRGGPRTANGKIWDFCAVVGRPYRQWCYEGFKDAVIGACRNATRLTSGVGKACRERAKNLPSNLPSAERTAKAKQKCNKGGGLVGALNCVTRQMDDDGDKRARKEPKEAQPPAPPAASSTVKNTGVTTTSVRNPDGSRTVTKTDKEGNVLSKETVGRSPASASSTDQNTGVTTSSVRNPDGTRTVTKTDKAGNVISKEVVGKAPASASSTDNNTGLTTTSVQNPDGTRTVTTTDRDGNILSREKVR